MGCGGGGERSMLDDSWGSDLGEGTEVPFTQMEATE